MTLVRLFSLYSLAESFVKICVGLWDTSIPCSLSSLIVISKITLVQDRRGFALVYSTTVFEQYFFVDVSSDEASCVTTAQKHSEHMLFSLFFIVWCSSGIKLFWKLSWYSFCCGSFCGCLIIIEFSLRVCFCGIWYTILKIMISR